MRRLYEPALAPLFEASLPPEPNVNKQSNEMKVMKKKILNMTIAVMSAAATLSALTALAADDDMATQAQQTIANFQSADSNLKTFMNNSAGYAVFPSVGKGGLIVGGARGKGLLYENGAITGRTTLTQASIGAQAGGQTFSQIICFESPAAVSDFKAGKFELGADISAVVASQGASQSAKYKQGVAVFTMPKSGLMVQATVGGQKFSFEPLMPTGR